MVEQSPRLAWATKPFGCDKKIWSQHCGAFRARVCWVRLIRNVAGKEVVELDVGAGANGDVCAYYNGARWYMPQYTRYTQTAPAGFVPSSVFNPHAYALNDPADITDPTGLDVYVGFHAVARISGHLFFIINDGPGGAQGNLASTISGEPSIPGFGGWLQSKPNADLRSMDGTLKLNVPDACAQSTADYRLRAGERNYREFHNTAAPYLYLPANSNSFLHGLGNAAGIALLTSPATLFGPGTPAFYPGYNQPLTPFAFAPSLVPNPIPGTSASQ